MAGVFFRIFHYFDNRSLWEDEVFLASSLVRMSFHDLATLPLDYQQRAPIGFLWLVRLSVILFGNKEMSLRLFPLICGISSIILFVPVARYFVRSNHGVMAAVFIVAIAPPLIYHSVEVKQYGTEFLASVLCLFLYVHFYQKNGIKNLLVWGITGGAILWISFSALFILAGIAIAVSLTFLIKKEWKNLFLHLIPFSIWLFSFAVQYVFFLSKFPEEEWLLQFWRNREAFMPIPPKSLHDILWPFIQIYSLIRYPLGLTWIDLDYKHEYNPILRVMLRQPFLPILVGLLGLKELFVRQKQHLLLFACPVILALIASSLELYPLKERLTVFLAPIFVIVVAKGVDAVYRLRTHSTMKNILIIVLIGAPLFNSTRQIINTSLFGDYKKSRQREAMQYIQQRYKKGDVVYVYWNNLPSFLYYVQTYNFSFNTIYGKDFRKTSTDFRSYFNSLQADFSKIKGNERLWYAYKPYNSLKIGDIENRPNWYYYNVDANSKVLDELAKLGSVKVSYPSSDQETDIRLILYELPLQKK
ncbi:glycosyltransferase family 39 protein [Dyadobacter frigoris]|uniref:glycosyltransferase family 39 protein n=1 Tax=Dyadobacter frigoris TaxID=2576211 RepID=UPI00255782BF|nr:glycosyltransferase family 39 protein [Dyadobacter frigoris]